MKSQTRSTCDSICSVFAGGELRLQPSRGESSEECVSSLRSEEHVVVDEVGS